MRISVHSQPGRPRPTGRPRRPRPPRSSTLVAAVFALAVGAPLGCTSRLSHQQDVSVAETIVQMGDAINDLRQQNADLTTRVDSLQTALARQDTLMRRIASAAGVPVP